MKKFLKPGWQSTEFWVLILADVGVALLGAVDPDVKAIVIAGMTALYTAGRTAIKTVETLKGISDGKDESGQGG